MDESEISLAEDEPTAVPRQRPGSWGNVDSSTDSYGPPFGHAFPVAYPPYPDPTIKRLGVVAGVVALIVMMGAGVLWSDASRERRELQAQVDQLSQSVSALTPSPGESTGSALLPEFPTEAPAAALPPVDIPDARIMVPLTVYSDPVGADVWIDDNFAGFTPLPGHLIEARAHTIRVVKEGYAAQVQQIALRPGDDPEVVFIRLKSAGDDGAGQLDAESLPGSLPRERPARRATATNGEESDFGGDTLVVGNGTMRITSTPQHAEVRLSGRLVGRTPLSLPNLGPGVYSISVSEDGFYHWDSRVRVGPDQTVVIDAQLRKR